MLFFVPFEFSENAYLRASVPLRASVV